MQRPAGPAPSTRGRLAPIADLSAAELSQWRDLAAASVEPNPFHEPEFTLPAARYLATGAPVGLLRVVRDGRWLAALPVQRRRSWKRMPLPSASLWLTLEHHYLGAPLVRADALEEGVAVLLDTLRSVPGSTFAWMGKMPGHGRVAGALEDALRRRGAQPMELDRYDRAILRRGPSAEELLARLSGKHRRATQRLARQLAEAAQGELSVVDRGEDPEAIERFIAQEAAGWKGQRGQPVAHEPRLLAFYREMTAEFRRLGRLQVACLEAAGKPLAITVNLIAPGGVYVLRITYDEDYARWSPGHQLMLGMADVLRGVDGAEWVDSGASGHNAMFNRLWPDRREIAEYLVPAAGARGAAGLAAIRAVWPLRERAVAALQERDRRRREAEIRAT